MFVLGNSISFHAVNEMMKQINSVTGFISIWVEMFHLNFMSNLLNFATQYIIRNLRVSVGSRSSLPSSNNFFFFWIELSLATLFT